MTEKVQPKTATEWEERSIELCEALREAAVNDTFARVRRYMTMAILSKAENEYERHLANKPKETEDSTDD